MITSYPLLKIHAEKQCALKWARRKALSAQASKTCRLMMKVTLPVSEPVTPLRNNIDNTFLAYLIKLGHEWLYSREAVGAARSDCFADNASSPETLIVSQIPLGSELLSGKLDTSSVCIGWVPVWWLNRTDSTSLLPPSWMEGLSSISWLWSRLRLCWGTPKGH